MLKKLGDEMNQMFFHNRKANPEKLLAYGFVQDHSGYCYGTEIADGQFRLVVSISRNGEVRTQVIDKETGDEYILHRTAKATGAFVGTVKADYEAALTEIDEKCFDPDVFKSEQAKEIIAYVREKYGDELEFLWKKFPENAIWRRKDTNKWYAALLTVSANKLGLDSNEMVEIIDLRMKAEDISQIVDFEKYFPGYHMNKKHWITICLDGAVPMEELHIRIDHSYVLATK